MGADRPSARRLALEVFLAWDSGRESADALFGRHPAVSRLESRDRELAHAMVRGVFRWRGRLDWQLSHLVTRPLPDLDASVRWTLRLGLYQLEHLDRVPDHAAVDTSVELAKKFCPRGASGMVNAVLRRAKSVVADLVEPDASENPAAHLVARTSHPEWLLERWLSRYGFRRTLQLAASNNEKPSLTLRVASDRVEAVDLIEGLRAHGAQAEPGNLLPDTVRLPGGWHPALTDILESGLAVVQDEAAGLVAHVARPAGGLRVLDVCAAPGGKTLHFAELCGDAVVVAADLSPSRLGALRQTIERTAVKGIYPIAADGHRPATRGGFGRVLVDAPCSNTGVLGRRADARWRQTLENVERLARLQLELLESARAQVGTGGLLVYSTCSLEPEENADVVRTYLERHPSDELVSAGEVLPDELVQDGCLQTHPVDHGVDGAFAATFRPAGKAFEVLP
ncbi:MAG: 16S rRNA (cytosine(967)-C(5))-methyltransferase RsmB [Planctomycetota bacterium]